MAQMTRRRLGGGAQLRDTRLQGQGQGGRDREGSGVQRFFPPEDGAIYYCYCCSFRRLYLQIISRQLVDDIMIFLLIKFKFTA